MVFVPIVSNTIENRRLLFFVLFKQSSSLNEESFSDSNFQHSASVILVGNTTVRHRKFGEGVMNIEI